jgi:hypothetical protein
MQSSLPPEHIIQGLEADVYHLLWAKDHEFDAQTVGSNTKDRPYIKHTAVYNKRKWHENTGLGLGLLDLENHAKALRVQWLLKYLDASKGQWKLILDCWFARSRFNRGQIFLLKPIDNMIGPMKKDGSKDSCLPKFWKSALFELRELGLKRGQTTPLGAESQPLRYNIMSDVQPDPNFRKVWQTLKTHTVAHLTNDEYQQFTRDESEKALDQYNCDTIQGTVIIKGERYVISEVLDSFEALCNSIPKEWLLKPMSHKHPDQPCEGAWWGQRDALALLQRTSKTEIDMTTASNTKDEILHGTRGKKKRKPLKAYYYENEGNTTYVLYKEENDTYYDTLMDPQGRLHKQEPTQPVGEPIPTAR